jgi:serine protease
MMKSARLVLMGLVAGLLTQTAEAARYMVVFKDKEVFQQTHMQLVMKGMALQSVRVMKNGEVSSPFAKSPVEVEDSLPTLGSLVINTEDSRAVEALAQSQGVAFVEKEVFHPAPRPLGGYVRTQAWDYSLAYSVKGSAQLGPKTPWGIHAVKASNAWALSSQGAGSRVLVLDTGIDRDHPALKGNFEKGQDFVNDNNRPYDVADHVGHGTHVAGTIAAEFGADGFVGVAPRAKILAGRVCSEQGCSNIAVAQGIQWGIQEKVDVINMSLGGPFATASEKRAVEAAEAAGVIIVAASGNDGKPKVSFPASFPTAIAVGAVNDKIQKADFSNWGPQLDVVAPGVAVISAVPLGSGRESMVKVGNPGAEVEVLSTGFAGAPDVLNPISNELVFAGLGKPESFQGISVAGKFALIQRGEVNFAEKVKNAIAAGAAAVVIFNNAPGLIQGALTQDGSMVAIPVVMIEQGPGEALKNALQKGAKARAIIQTVATDYSAFDGTSMASPHVAGVVALMRAAKKSLSPAQARDILKQTSQALTPNDQNQYGSGMVNAEAAVQSAVQ